MTRSENIAAIGALLPDMMGFIFYRHSPRFAQEDHLADCLPKLDSSIKKTGVFVNETSDEILRICRKLHFDFVQLHGNETPDTCREIRESGFGVIKVFHADHTLNMDKLEPYATSSDYFLFDTKTTSYGGSGAQFDWEVLRNYTPGITYLLSGGIGPDDIERIQHLKLPGMEGIDINSRVESSPGIKDVAKVEQIIQTIRRQ